MDYTLYWNTFTCPDLDSHFTKDYLLTLVFVNSNLSITHLDLRVIENNTHLKSILCKCILININTIQS